MEILILSSPSEESGAPLTSVVVPAFDRVLPLRALLDSLASQHLASGFFEVVLSDDGSGPEVEKLARELAPHFECFILVKGPNAGPGMARNRGSMVARGHVVAFIDSDCVALPGWLDRITHAGLGGRVLAYGPVESSIGPLEPFIHSFQTGRELVPGANFAMRRTDFLALGGFDRRVSRLAEDHEIAARAAAGGLQRVYVADAVVVHPPRVKSVAWPWVDGGERYATLRAFFDTVPARRPEYAEVNRLLLLKALAKLSIMGCPVLLAPTSPWLWPAGLAALMMIALLKWGRANRAFTRAGEPLRVPLRDALKYALVLPLGDLFEIAARFRHGLFFLKA